MLFVYGDSDDLVILEGSIRAEYDCFSFEGNNGGVVTLTSGEDSLDVECIFTWEGKWLIAPVASSDTPEWPMAVRFGERTVGQFGGVYDKDDDGNYFNPVKYRAAEYTAILVIDVPHNTTATFKTTKELGRS